ncbi:MAG: DUF6883 domain-containing protein [Balneolaceae bacterium]
MQEPTDRYEDAGSKHSLNPGFIGPLTEEQSEAKAYSKTYAYKLGIKKSDIEELRKSVSTTDILFVDNIIHQYSKYFHDIPSEDKVLSALYIIKNYDTKTARKRLKNVGFTETFVLWTDYGEIGHILAAYDMAKNGLRSAKLDTNYSKQRHAERTALLAMMGGQIVNKLMTGPDFNPNTGYSDKSMLDQLEKEGYLSWEQRQAINTRLIQGAEPEGAGNELNRLPKTTAESVSTKLDTYLLEPTHPVGGSKAKWFKEALGFTKDNSTDLAKQIVFDPKKAVQTATNAHGTKFSQIIPVQGANGKIINVEFIFIKNNDGVTRLVTSIPTKR